MSAILNGIPEEKLSQQRENILTVSGRAEDLAILILHTLRDAFFYCRGCYQSSGLTEGEVLSAAYEGLSAAAKNFKPERIRFLGYAKPYLRGALSRACRSRNIVKKVKETEGLPIESVDEIEDEPPAFKPIAPSSGQDPEFELIYLKEDWAQIEPLMRSALNDKERMILELNFRGGFNLRQIADLLETTRSDTHHTKSRALKKLRHKLIKQKRYYNRK